MKLELLRTYYTYSAWANKLMLDTAERLTTEQFTAHVGASFPSVRDTLVHTLSAQRYWLSQFQKQGSTDRLVGADFADVAAIRALWDDIEAQTQTFLAGLEEAALEEVFPVTDRTGNVFDFNLWQIMLHQANHAMQHRSEVAVMLTQFGHSPGDQDFLVYVDLYL